MNFLAQQTHGRSLLRDEDSTQGIWPLDLLKELINQGRQETADLLPEEELPILRASKAINLSSGVTEYGIEASGGFNLSDYNEDIGVQVSDGSTMRWATKVDADLMDDINPYWKATKYEPTYSIGEYSSTPGERAVNIRPSPSGAVGNGLKLHYVSLVNTLSGDSDICVLPPKYHKLPVWYAVALMLAKEQKDKGLQNAMRYWKMWRDALVSANAKYKKGIEVPPLTEKQ